MTDTQCSVRRRFRSGSVRHLQGLPVGIGRTSRSARAGRGRRRGREGRFRRPSRPSLAPPARPYPLTFSACPPFLKPFHPSNTNVFDCISTSLPSGQGCSVRFARLPCGCQGRGNRQALFGRGRARRAYLLSF